MQNKDNHSEPGSTFWAPDFRGSQHLARLIRLALDEDLAAGDITTEAIVPPGLMGRAVITAKEPMVTAGMDAARLVFEALDPEVDFEVLRPDGATVQAGDVLARVTGRMRVLLRGERTALNFLQRLSGVASNTRAYMEAARGLSVKLVDTRKTTPGWRMLEKYAVRVGGAANHRMGLFDGVLIKDNHIAAAGGIRPAVEKARAGAPHMVRIEVEAAGMDQVREALDSGADVIMLDNMDAAQVREAAAFIAGRALVEVSGGVTRERLRELAQAGVDIISCGALTHAARAMDISMTIEEQI